MINRIGIVDNRNNRINEKAKLLMITRNGFACSIKIALIVCSASIALMFPGCSKPDDPNKPTIQKYSPGKIGNSRYKPPTVRLEMLTPEKNQVFKKPKSIECRVRMILDKGDEMPCRLHAQMRFKSKKGYVLYSNGLMDPKIDRDHSDPNTVAYICTVTFKSSEIFKPHQYEAFVERVDDVVYLKPKDKNDHSSTRKTEIKSTTLASLIFDFEVK